MSKIYQALEKAEREREADHIKGSLPLLQVQEKETAAEEIPPGVRTGEATGEATVSNHQLVSFFEPGSIAAEQFRKLRSHLIKLKVPESMKTLMVTSALQGEGKSFVAANLAVGIANDFRTEALLVDCDLRNPSLSQWFSLTGDKGLSDYLVGNGHVGNLIVNTEVDKLSLLPAGKVSENPTELVGSRKMESLVRELKANHSERYIIFDSTPLLATTEPEVLSKWVDGIILVVRAGFAPRETIQQAIKSLVKEKIIGVVLNDLDFRSSTLYSRYFGSSYYYGYGYPKKDGNHNGSAKKFSRLIPWKKH